MGEYKKHSLTLKDQGFTNYVEPCEKAPKFFSSSYIVNTVEAPRPCRGTSSKNHINTLFEPC